MATLYWDLCTFRIFTFDDLACPPYYAFAVGIQCNQKFQFKVDTLENGVCVLKEGENSIVGEDAICDYFISKCADQSLLGGDEASLVKEWRDIAASVTKESVLEVVEKLDTFIATRTYILRNTLSLADIALWAAIKLTDITIPEKFPYAARWFNFISAVPSVKQTVGRVGGTLRMAAKQAAAPKKEVTTKKGEISLDGTPESMPELPFAEEGKVVTRFPPEASGYMHVGHVKAAMLNYYYAKRYHGKLLLRFDDTNPSKEKQEFETSIIDDLAKLGIKADLFSHTSDYFDVILDYARQLIREGLAFMDNTDQETMRKERMERKESKMRDTPVEENMRLFEALCRGEPEMQDYCLRAKIDMKSDNGTMRDPVLVRYFPLTHIRTGDKYKAYPCYDLACPIVDSIEGVTHAMRTTEYKDRDEQYVWIQRALRLREVHLVEFARLNFQYTLMSKRKLTWMVEHHEVDGWDDPRFPTVKGVLRRGVQVEALRSFILSQGFSKRVVTMEWDKFWSDNKKILERNALRYMGVMKDDFVVIHLTNVENGYIQVANHPKDESKGVSAIAIGPDVMLERTDAETLKEGEEFTLMRWGNAKVASIQRDDAGQVTGLTGEFVPNGDFKNTTKVNWVACSPENHEVTVVEYDDLLTKKALEENDNFEDFLTSKDHPTKIAYTIIVNNACKDLKENEIVQLERRGFYRCDRPDTENEPATLILIPDGKKKAMSKLSGMLGHK